MTPARSPEAERFDPPLRTLRWRVERSVPFGAFLADARARVADDPRFESALRHGGILLDRRPLLAEGAPAGVSAGAGVVLYAFEREPAPVALAADALLAEDDDLVVVAKPPWLTMQGSRASQRLSLEALVRERTGDSSLVAAHRLDRQTSGVALFARGPAAARALGRVFAERRVEKRYLALVAPPPAADAFELAGRIARVPDPARPRFGLVAEGGAECAARFRVLARAGARALVAAAPATGRTHQLRVQLAAAGHPVVGDDHYGPAFAAGAASAAGRVQLHAARLSLPALGGAPPRTFEAPLPADFEAEATELLRSALRSGAAPLDPEGGAETPWT